ncbi:MULTISPECIES: DUF2188 domain-containing protein [unclassified Aeromicrobium]|uniref:DUF2188 domain-containing protein n=1 Tax=unclassified Aeromicrobium TaxID=2633570 RepID=UPI0037BFD863
MDVVHRDGTWHLRSAGRSLSSHDTKDEAIAEGVRVARNNEPSQLIIHLADGTFEEERTYGEDPYPPAG